MAQAPGFAEWRKTEDRRIMDQLIKKFEDEGQLLVEPLVKDNAYYEMQAKNAHKIWEQDLCALLRGRPGRRKKKARRSTSSGSSGKGGRAKGAVAHASRA